MSRLDWIEFDEDSLTFNINGAALNNLSEDMFKVVIDPYYASE